MSEEAEVKGRPWREIPELEGSKLESLFNDLAEIKTLQADLDSREQAVRTLIEPIIKPLGFPVKVGKQQAQYFPESETAAKLDPVLIVKSGTPIQPGWYGKPGKRKAYLRISPVKDE